jgi:hypothetical protein
MTQFHIGQDVEFYSADDLGGAGSTSRWTKGKIVQAPEFCAEGPKDEPRPWTLPPGHQAVMFSGRLRIVNEMHIRAA